MKPQSRRAHEKRIKETLVTSLRSDSELARYAHHSASHTWTPDGKTAAVLIAVGPERVGVDLECRGRNMLQAVFDRVASFEERQRLPHWSGLDFWVVKESLFKACPQSEGTWISQYSITKVTPSEVGPSASACDGEAELLLPTGELLVFVFRKFTYGEYLISVAKAR